MADMMYGTVAGSTGGGDLSEDNTNDYYGTGYGAAGAMSNNIQPRQRYPGLYVGNLTWWTTDQDVINAINSSGVNDVQEVKFFENRNNGQSKGFCVVTFNSEASLPIVTEKLPKLELHGQNPVVTPYNRQSLNLFESQTKPRPQINSNNGPTPQHAAGIMGINSISGVHAQAAAAAAAAAAASSMAYSGVNAYNQQGVGGLGGGPRNPNYHSNMRMQMRTPRPQMMRGSMPGSMNNGPMMPGGPHQMNRMPRFMQPQGGWNNSQGGYNQGGGTRMPQVGMDMNNRLSGGGGGMGLKQGDDSGHDMLSNSGSQNYYTPQHPVGSSQSDHYSRSDIMRDHGSGRDHMRDHDRDRDRERERDRDRERDRERDRGDRDRGDRESRSGRLLDERPSILDDRSLRHDDRSIRDDRSSKHHDDRSERSSRRGEERSSRREEERPRRDDRRDERPSRRADERTTAGSTTSSSRRDKSHRTEERDASRRSRSRSRDKERERSRDRKDRRDRRERYG